MNKKAMRRQGLLARRDLEAQQRVAKSRLIGESLCNSILFQQSKSIFCYVGSEDEVHTMDILQRVLAEGKQLSVPYITDAAQGVMEAAVLNKIEDLVPGIYNIPTVPENKQRFLLGNAIDLVIVPGTAFDAAGRRIGMGGGFYDRFLQNISVSRVALAYACQIFDHLPVEEHDQQVDYIFTENKIYTREDLR